MSLLRLVSMQRLILASASPARAKLLKEAGFKFDIVVTDIDEDAYKAHITDPETLVKTLAEAKAKAVSPTENTIIAADTIVVCNGEIIGKPIDRHDAKQIIQKLAGNTHAVWTGVCIMPQKHLFADKADLTWYVMTDQEIEAYLDTNEWQGKAGGYQIQKSIRKYVAKIDGYESTIIGLPIELIRKYVSKEKKSEVSGEKELIEE